MIRTSRSQGCVQPLLTTLNEKSQVLDLNGIIMVSWAHNMCKSGLDPIDCKSSFSSLDISVGLPLSIEIISLISDITMKGFTGSEYSHWFSLNFCLCCSNLSEFEINLNNSSIAAWQAAGAGAECGIPIDTSITTDSPAPNILHGSDILSPQSRTPG